MECARIELRFMLDDGHRQNGIYLVGVGRIRHLRDKRCRMIEGEGEKRDVEDHLRFSPSSKEGTAGKLGETPTAPGDAPPSVARLRTALSICCLMDQ